ncbi:MAG: hypothetical protein ACK55I_39615, partial [bacterium]
MLSVHLCFERRIPVLPPDCRNCNVVFPDFRWAMCVVNVGILRHDLSDDLAKGRVFAIGVDHDVWVQ